MSLVVVLVVVVVVVCSEPGGSAGGGGGAVDCREPGAQVPVVQRAQGGTRVPLLHIRGTLRQGHPLLPAQVEIQCHALYNKYHTYTNTINTEQHCPTAD